jgi:hypothetical protein
MSLLPGPANQLRVHTNTEKLKHSLRLPAASKDGLSALGKHKALRRPDPCETNEYS